jgi:hypothetical protein
MTDQKPNYTPFKPGSFEVTIRIFKKREFPQEDIMMAHTSKRFDTIEEVISWADKAKVCFE